MVVTKKMAFFSEAVGHAAMTGIAIGVLLGEPFSAPYISLFTYLDTSLEQIKKYILEKWGSDDKYRIIDSPFQFNLYHLCPPTGGAHFPKLYFFTPKLCKNKCIIVLKLF